MTNNQSILEQEIIAADEATVIENIVRMSMNTQLQQNAIAKRAQHGKHHGCVEAKFTVLPDIPEELQHGVFKEEKTFDAQIRFSNGAKDDDTEPDAHGMAIKLEDVAGTKLLPGREKETCQDFILVDHPVFFTANMQEYYIFNKYVTKIMHFSRNKKSLSTLIGFIHGLGAMLICHSGLLKRAKQFASGTPASPFSTHYWSTTPYLLGDQAAVKYMARSSHLDNTGVQDPDGLSKILKQTLQNKSVEFEFGVCKQTNPKSQPIEDATVDWDKNNDHFMPLAKITIAKQDVNTSNSELSLVENLVFNPWHALACHRPLGAVNRARRNVYVVMSILRHEKNGIQPVGSSEVLQSYRK